MNRGFSPSNILQKQCYTSYKEKKVENSSLTEMNGEFTFLLESSELSPCMWYREMIRRLHVSWYILQWLDATSYKQQSRQLIPDASCKKQWDQRVPCSTSYEEMSGQFRPSASCIEGRKLCPSYSYKEMSRGFSPHQHPSNTRLYFPQRVESRERIPHRD